MITLTLTQLQARQLRDIVAGYCDDQVAVIEAYPESLACRDAQELLDDAHPLWLRLVTAVPYAPAEVL